MFEGMPRAGRSRWNPGMVASFAFHLGLLLLLLHGAAAVFVKPSEVDLGIPHSYGSQSITYLAAVGPERMQSQEEQPRLVAHSVAPRTPQPPKAAPPRELPAQTAINAPDETARGGSLYGRLPGSPMTGHDVIPGFPVVFPDPPRPDLPKGVQGDVIVQVTIDPEGNVVDTKLLQGIGYGIEQKVLEVVQRWRFHPATRDGVTIASQQLVYFHYPS